MADSVKFVAGGTVQAGGGIYIRRRADQELLALCRSGAFAYVLTPRQMGKSSLMVQTANALKEQGIRSVTVDLTKIGTLLDAEAWYLGLLTAICRKFGLMRNLLKWWQAHKYLGITQRFTQFIDEVMLTEVSERIVIFVDEIDTTLNLDFTDDFFAAIRSFYLDRAENPAFARLSFVLIGVATPSDLIKNSQRTPFNIGQRVDLTDFTFEEGLPLADGFKLPIEKAHQLLKWIIKWTGGHPYLTQRLCRELVNKKLLDCSELEIDQLVNTLFLGDKSTQDNNLNFVRDMLVERTPDLAKVLTIYRDICNERRTILDDERSIFKSHLKLAGVVVRHNDIDGFKLIVRNRIYKEVFNVAWATKNLPINTMLFGEAVETDQNYSYVLGGTVQSGGGVYIPRKADRELLELCRSGTFAYVLTPRQTGKSSLLANVASDLAQAGIRPIKVDLAAVGTQIDAEAWYLGLLTIISRQLDLQRQLMKWWKNHKHLGITQRLTQFIEEVILGKVSERIVIFIDEIDTTLNLDFTDDFFIAIRSLYSARAENSEFERLSFVLFGVATPSDLILSPQRTPFNIGQRVDLTDFTFEEALPLADGFDLPTEEAQQLLQWVLDWTAGHPYLTQRFCKELRKEHLNKWSEVAVAEVVKKIFLKDASKQDTNLQFVRDMLTRRSPDTEKELNTYREVLLGKHKVTDEEISLVKSHLKLSGVVKRSPDGVLQVRNKIYRQVFDLAWVKENLPINWLKSLRRAAVTSTIIFLVATAPLGIFAEFQRRVAVNRGDELEKRGIELEERSNQLEIVLADAEEARKDAELARQNEAKQRKLAEEGRQKAEIERKRAEKAKQEEEIALKAEERERKKAVVARNAEAKQRTIAEQEKRRAENFAVVANIRENSTRALNYLLTARAVEGLILAMHATIQTQELSSDIDPKLASDLLSLVASTLLKAEEAVKEQMIFRGHEGEVLTAAFSPDDQMIVSGGVDNTVRLWDLRGNQIGDFLEHESDVVGVSFSSDGQKIIAVGRNGVVKQWSISGTPIDSFEAITSFDVVSVSYSADGQIVAVSLADGSVAVGNLSGTGWQEWIVNQPLVRVVDASLDENHEVVESENKLVDVYPIVGTAGQEIEISMESEDFDTYLILENSEKERIKEDDDGGDGSNSFMNVILPEDGNYKIIATTYETNASGEYQITVDQLKVIESPLLREETTLDKKHEIDQIPVTSGDNYSGDSYLIQGDAGQEISISMESSKFDTYLILENSTGEIIAQDDDRGNGNNSLLRTVIPETGTYRIIATNVNNEEGSGLYSLQVNELERSQTSSVNKTSASLDEGDQVIQITTRIGDVYSFEGKQGQQITVNMESEDFDTQLILQTAEGKTIAENDDREGDTNSFLSTVLPV
ncbi:MAG: AAA-like domain-containing protein, partial [Cyanobacteria bacterium P01_F01_bin.143]